MFKVTNSIKGKLGLGFGLILALVCALGATAYISLEHSIDTTDRIYAKNLKGLSAIASVDANLNSMQTDLLRVLNTRNDASFFGLGDRIGEARGAVEQRWAEYYPALLTTPTEKAEAEKVIADYQALIPQLEEFVEVGQNEGAVEANDFYAAYVDPAFNGLRSSLAELADYQVTRAGEFHDQAITSGRQEEMLIMAALAGVIVLSLIVAVVLARMITRPLDSARSLVESIAEGRLDNEVSHRYRDEFGSMINALAGMQNRLGEIVFKVRQSSESVGVGASQIASGNDELSSRTQEQAANLEETAASMEQMTSTVKQNADNAAQADQLARGVRSQASEGGQVVGRAVAAMQEINDSSRKISEIVGLIDDIAFQTNLLALNASVEAARAGEQGRGFAVVASEVRNLASRSAAAAKDIKSLVEDSAAKVADGSEQVALSGKTLDAIVESVHKVGDIISEIAAASSEQSSGIEQVNLAVSQMDSMTQQNASLVEQSAAASRSLEEQANGLKRQVAYFRLSGDAAAAASALAPAATTVAAQPAPAGSQDKPKPATPIPSKPKPAVKTGADFDEQEWATF